MTPIKFIILIMSFMKIYMFVVLMIDILPFDTCQCHWNSTDNWVTEYVHYQQHYCKSIVISYQLLTICVRYLQCSLKFMQTLQYYTSKKNQLQQDLELHGLKKHWFWRYMVSNFAKNYTDYHFLEQQLKDTQFCEVFI